MKQIEYFGIFSIGLVVTLLFTVLVSADNDHIEPTGAEPVLDKFVYLPMVIRPTADIQITYILFNPIGGVQLDEYVTIENKDNVSQNMTGWILHDNADIHEFVFPEFTLEAGAQVNVWTKAGANTQTDLYWGLGNPIWNNTGDTATLKDDKDELIDTCIYNGSGSSVICGMP